MRQHFVPVSRLCILVRVELAAATASMRALVLIATFFAAALQPLDAVKITPDVPSVSVPYNVSGRLTGIQELPLNYVSEDGQLSLVAAPGCSPEQVGSLGVRWKRAAVCLMRDLAKAG